MTAAAPAVIVPVVLLAALLHAGWNAILKSVGDKLLSMLMISVVAELVAAVAVFFAGVPSRASWALLVCSGLLHVGYSMMLVRTFEIGDFNLVYPLARGLSPVLVAAVAAAIGDPLSGTQAVGMAVVCAGLTGVVFSSGRPHRADRQALGYAVATGVFIATYTVVDGLAVRRSGTAVGYTSWMMLVESWMIAVACLAAMARRARTTGPNAGPGVRMTLASASPQAMARGAVAGALSPLAYGLVLWAQTRGALATVSALRETSVIFGAALASLFLREPFGRYRVYASIAIAGGIIILELA